MTSNRASNGCGTGRCDGCVATDYRQQRVRELDEQIATLQRELAELDTPSTQQLDGPPPTQQLELF